MKQAGKFAAETIICQFNWLQNLDASLVQFPLQTEGKKEHQAQF
jgi:hypothetical protein